MSAPACDHVVWFVEDLDRARDAWEDAGFTVTPGGTHAGGLTSNALIALADGTYIELLRVNLDGAFELMRRLRATRVGPWALRGRSALDRRFVPMAGEGPGPRSLALGVDDLAAAVARVRARGVRIGDPQPGERLRADGQRVAWYLGMPDARMPFLIEDVTARDLRVPGGEATRHANGAEGIERIELSTPDPPGVVRYLSALVGSGPTEETEHLSFFLTNAEVLVRREPGRQVVEPTIRGRGGPVGAPVP